MVGGLGRGGEEKREMWRHNYTAPDSMHALSRIVTLMLRRLGCLQPVKSLAHRVAPTNSEAPIPEWILPPSS